MPTAYILWDRKAQTVVCSSGVPMIFAASASASKHVNESLVLRCAPSESTKTYDVLSVSVA